MTRPGKIRHDLNLFPLLCVVCGLALRTLRFKICNDSGEVQPLTAKGAKKGRKGRKATQLEPRHYLGLRFGGSFPHRAIVRKTSTIEFSMSVAARLNYYRRVSSAYLLPGKSQLTFWHDQAQVNPTASVGQLGEYYMPFLEKADHAGPYDAEEFRCSTTTARLACNTTRLRSRSGDWETSISFSAAKTRSVSESRWPRPIGW